MFISAEFTSIKGPDMSKRNRNHIRPIHGLSLLDVLALLLSKVIENLLDEFLIR